MSRIHSYHSYMGLSIYPHHLNHIIQQITLIYAFPITQNQCPNPNTVYISCTTHYPPRHCTNYQDSSKPVNREYTRLAHCLGYTFGGCAVLVGDWTVFVGC